MQQQRSIFLFLLLLGVSLRILGALGDLWLDEIWSLRLIAELSSPFSVFYAVHSDNNHILNSLYLFLIGMGHEPSLYRAFSLICAVASFPLLSSFAAQLTTDRSRHTNLFAVLLYAVSFVMVLYGSEARGYSLSFFFALLSFLGVKQYLASASLRAVLLAWSALCLGFLSHYTFGFFYLALFLWQVECAGTQVLREIGRIAVVHCIPALLLVILYYIDFRYVPEGSGTFYPFIQVWLESFAVPLGAPQFSNYNINAALLAFVVAVGVACVLLAEVIRLKRRADALWVFFASIIFFIPICSVLTLEPRVFYVRYFFLPLAFALVLFAHFLARLWQESKASRALCVIICCLILLGNSFPLVRLVKFGRGEYLAAFRFIVAASPGSAARIATNQSFRAQMMLGYYQQYTGQFTGLRLEKENASGPTAAPWYILQQEDVSFPAGDTLSSASGDVFKLVARFSHAGLSGASWYLYRRP